MRTKTLLLAAAISAVGIASTMAQAVYSVNVVGYHSTTVGANKYAIIANQLQQSDQRLPAIIPAPPENSRIIKYNAAGGTFQISNYEIQEDESLAWSNPNLTLAPGEAAWFLNRGAAPYTLTFVGEVRQGNLSHSVPAGFSFQSSEVPQQGGVQTVLNYQPGENDRVYLYRNDTYVIRTYEIQEDETLNWSGGEPVPNVGEGYWILNRGATKNWTRTFNITN